MKKTIVFAVITIVLFSVILITDILSNSSEAELNANIQPKAEQSVMQQDKDKQNAELQYETEQNAKMQYELMCKNIEENSDYYENFSKKFISVFKEYGYDKFDTDCGFFEKHLTEERLEYDFDSDLVGRQSSILNHKGISYIIIDYPERIEGFNYCNKHSEYHYYYDYYVVVYILDGNMDEASIDILNEEVYAETLKNIKDNLFVAWRWEPRC
jgi:hypothetical protein